MSKEKQIFLPVEDKKEIIKSFKTTKETLWAALNFKTDSNFARMLGRPLTNVAVFCTLILKGYQALSLNVIQSSIRPKRLWYKVSVSGLNW